MSGKGRKQPSKPEGKLGRACRIEVGESQHPENQAAEKPNDEREVIDLLSDTSDVDDDDGGGLSESPAPKRMRLMQNKKIPATQTSFSYDCSDEYERHQAAILAAATQAASTESYTTQKGRHDEQQQKEDEDEEQFFDAQEEEPEQRVEAPASASLLLTNNKNNTKPTPGIEVAFHAALNEASRAPELTQNDNTRVYRRKSISESKQDETKASAMTQRRRRTIQECKSAIETKSSLEETIPARQSTRSQRSTATINSSRTEAPLKPAANLPSRRLTSKPVAVGSPSTTAVTHRRSTTVPLEASGTNPAGAAPCKISAKSQESTKTSEREMLQALQKLKDDAYSLQGKGRPNLLQNIFKTITACNAQINQVSVSDDTLTSTTCLRLHASAKKWCYLLISDAIINGPAAQILQGTAKQDNTQILSSERKLLDALRDRNIAVSSLPRQIKMTCLQKLFTAILACEALIVQMHQDWDTEKQTDTTTTGDTAAAPQTLTNVDARDNAPARTAEASSASKASTVSRWSKRAVATDDAAAAAAHARPKTSYGHRKRPLGPLEAPAVDHPPLKLGKMPMADASRARKGATLATTAAAPRKNTPPATRAGASRAKSLSSSQTKAPPATHNGTKTRRAARENSPSSKPARKTAVAPAAARENSPVTRKKAPFRADSVSDDGSSTCDTKPFTRKSSASKRQLLRRAARKTSLSSVSDDCEAHSAADAMMDDTFPVVDSAEDDTPLLPTVQELSKQCWKCAVTLKLPAGQVCWYATHSHLLLAVPVCSVCAEEVAAVEINVFENDSNTYCAGCAASEDQADTLFFCDNEKAACQRAFCFDCVAKAHGGGVVGVDAARELEQDDELWHCPACSPPTQLLELRQRVARNTDDERNQLTRDLDFLLGQLDQAEQEKKWCELELNTDLEEKANEFRRDLRAEDVTLTVDELEEQVQEAVRVWYEDLQWHESRVADFISGLLDELDAEHSFTAKMCYMALGEGAPGQFDEEQNAPVWVQAADKEVDERMRERGKGPVFNPLGDAAYEEENFDDVEDLGPENLADDETLLLRSGWNMQQRPTARKVEIALRNEEMMRVRVRKVVTDAQDKEEILEDKRLAVARHVAGAIRNEFGSLGSTQGTLTSIQSRCPITLSGGQSQGNGRTQRSPAAENRVILNEKSSTFSKKSRTVSLSLSTDAQETGAIAAHGHDAIPVSAHTAPSISASSLVLCDAAGERNGDGLTPVRTVAVASQLSMILKPHQVEGVQFMWRNSFVDLAYNQEGKIDQCGGCVLAHSMGLGKSLATIALLHTVMTHPEMVSASKGESLIRTALLVVPVNTIANWENEFSIWQKHLPKSVVVTNLGDITREARANGIKRWSKVGGVLLVGEKTFVNVASQKMGLQEYLQPDVLVLDEAHMMLKNPKNKVYETLTAIKTPRKIALTGSPFQNNLFEYYHLIKFIRPDAFGHSNEATFDRDFVKPIMLGMASDASGQALYDSLNKSKVLSVQLEPYVHRVDATELLKDLPPMQQVVLHVRQTRMQNKLYGAYKRKQQADNTGGYKNFFRQYRLLGPIHNHPGSLLFPSEAQKNQKSEFSEDGDEIFTGDTTWWRATVEKAREDQVMCPMSGYKIVLLLHILASAEKIGDKVLVFANCLSTLNYIEYVLSLDWIVSVPSLASKFPGTKLGGWKKSIDYLRIDGAITSSERGDLVNQFRADDSVKAFLLSKAGGIGINLTSANRVILVDNHFNPTVATQSLFRVCRFGQTKPVFCYRLLTEGTMEERVYGRCVNKTGVALQVIDQMSISRCFTERELQDLMQNLQWVACDKCSKWRVLIGEVSEEALAAEWYCSMNTTDPINNNCIASEKSQQWYENHYFTNTGFEQSPADSPGKFSEEKFITKQTSEQTSNDEILQHLLGLTEEEKTTTLVSKHYFHEALMETTNSSEQLDKARQSMEMQKENEGVAATLTARTNNSNTADDGDKIETADAANGQAHMLDIASNATPPATKTAQVSTGDQSEIADVVLKNAQVLPAIGKATPPFPGRRQMLNTIGEAPLPFPIKVAQVSNGSQSQTFDVTEGQVLALPTAGEDASMSSRKMAHVLSCGQIEISDVAKRQTQELPPAGKVPSSTSIKRDRILAKSILCPSERMSIPDGENVCASNAVSANASDPAHEKFCRISPTSFDGDSADGIKVKVKGMSPLKLTGKATNQPRSSPAQQKKPPDAAAAALTGTCEHEAIDLCDTSDDDT